MDSVKFTDLYNNTGKVNDAIKSITTNHVTHISGLRGSVRSLISAAITSQLSNTHLFVLADEEDAVYFYNDLENILKDKDNDYDQKRVVFYPSLYIKKGKEQVIDNSALLFRTQVINILLQGKKDVVIVTSFNAITEKLVNKDFLKSNIIEIKVGENVTIDFLNEMFYEYNFERTDFVYEPGQFAMRGGIIDVFSYSNDHPYRIELSGDSVESIRSFDVYNQLSIQKFDKVTVISNIHNQENQSTKDSFFSFIHKSSYLWLENSKFYFEKLINIADDEKSLSLDSLLNEINNYSKIIEFGKFFYFDADKVIEMEIKPPPIFNKNFDLLLENLYDNRDHGIRNYILVNSKKQYERITSILKDIDKKEAITDLFKPIMLTLHEGFVDKESNIACYVDHEIFQRYHRFQIKDGFNQKEAITINEFADLKPGYYITHIDYGVGRFSGLEKITVNGKTQETIRLIYKENDILYVSIHALHKICKYKGKEGEAPTLHRLGSNVWNNLKAKTKKKVKDIAKDLIKLYAERKSKQGFGFSADSFMQDELEASFIYEDTPDQYKATVDVKADMEKHHPMDRLVCGDVGYGKTEVAIRAAFKAVADNKQVAVLVPTTILALQHYKTFSERLKDFPCKVDYLNRFKKPAEVKTTIKELNEGKVDILIGTHRLLSQDIKYKDLGLLIVDEEQKFGVAAKEKIKSMKANVDVLTLTATPIPRTLQFSLMGARDLSIINTPPPNRYPIHTEIHTFDKEIISHAINFEIARGGQVFFVHNRVNNIEKIAQTIRELCPGVSVAIGHGQMDGEKLEKIMLDFIEKEYDILLSTTIIESGLDIPNVNTIIINDAQNFGLSDMYQLRGRVGRSNVKAFCYLLIPSFNILTNEARKRLTAIEEYSDLGSGLNIAMQDLEIRGAGNILGGEQSGFINEIGFEMYHKILDEAVEELKESDFKEIFEESGEKEIVKDCTVETDLEIMIPDYYIHNTTERFKIYKELDNIDEESALEKIRMDITDRFGPIPEQTVALFDAIRMRWLAKKIGFEKIVLKNNRFAAHFVSDPESIYFKENKFQKVLSNINQHNLNCRFKDDKTKLSVIFENVKSIGAAIEILKNLNE